MNTLRNFLLLSLLATLLHAYAPHPTVLSVEYKEQMLPVVKVIGTDPVVVVDGKEKRITSEPAYLPQRAELFGKGWVQLSGITLGGSMMVITPSMEDANAMVSNSGPSMGASFFEATLQSKQTLQGGFAVVVAFPRSTAAFFLPAKYNQTSIVVHDLPELPAGTPVKVKFSSSHIRDGASLGYFIQIFDGNGREILSNISKYAWQYYSAMERVKLQGAIDRYRQMFPGGNHAAAPVMMTRPLLPDGFERPTELVPVRLTISADGLVTDLDLTSVGDQRLHPCIREALGGWLFLPRLKAGETVPCKVEVPIQF